MASQITLEVGDLYANMHEQFSKELGDQYEERLRDQFEEFVHNFNQQVERQMEAQEVDLSNDEIEELVEPEN